MLRIRCPFALGSASTGGCTNAVLSVTDADNLVLSSGGNSASWSFCSSLFSGTVILAKFGTNRQNTLQRPRNDLSSVKDVGGCSSLMASIVCEAVFKLFVRIVSLR